jgi:xylan 1,4-beta-xylosidase
MARAIVVLAALALASAGLAQTWKADNGNGTYTNPLFFDEFSDPDLIRVGSDFYLTGTTMHSMPGLPVLHSPDLVNWTFLGYALDRLDLGPSFRLEDGINEYGRGIWAPCFRYHEGTFYIFSNVNRETTQLFRASSPRGPWTRTPMKRSLHDLSVLFASVREIQCLQRRGRWVGTSCAAGEGRFRLSEQESRSIAAGRRTGAVRDVSMDGDL